MSKKTVQSLVLYLIFSENKFYPTIYQILIAMTLIRDMKMFTLKVEYLTPVIIFKFSSTKIKLFKAEQLLDQVG